MSWVQLGGSLAAVLGLAAIAWLMGLGGGTLGSPDEACAEAEAMLSGFEAERAVVGEDGRAALVFGRDGSLALLKLHGSRFAARQLHPPLDMRATENGLLIASGDARFGTVALKGVAGV